jgi:uncharacterized iron-regulated protein
MIWTRRTWLAVAAAGTLGACVSTSQYTDDRIVDTATGMARTADHVTRRMREADVVLLRGLHDKPHHHVRRAALLTGLRDRALVVAEHPPRGAAPRLAAGASGDALLHALEANGFDAKGWRWPPHEPLFAAIARFGIPLRGGKPERDAARLVARESLGALPADLAARIVAAPWTPAVRAALEQDFLLGHFGHLGADRMPGMVATQRVRDAAMVQALLAGLERLQAWPGHRPVILLSDNGHVRLDHGVPSLPAKRLQAARVLALGILEPTPSAPPARWLFDIVWTTPAATREDPCKAFPAARAAST